jgi:hypothetical protein
MGGGMKASWDAGTAMFECAGFMSAKIAMIDDRRAVRNVCSPAKKHAATTPARAPRMETPSKAAKDPKSDSHSEANSESQREADRRHHCIKPRVGDKQPAPDAPRVVIGNVNQSRIHRHNIDRAGVYNHALLWRRNQHVRLLRLRAHGLHSVHDVSGLVVVGVA